MRLDKFLADSGFGTRSDVKRIISRSRVSVNDRIITNSATHIDEYSDNIKVDGNIISFTEFEYFILNKPKGVISASKAEMKNPDVPCVVDLINSRTKRDLFPVGRLDKDTEGLLLITNDGNLAHNLLAPGKHVDKEYYVELSGSLSDKSIIEIEHGIDIGDAKPTLPCKINRISGCSCSIIIHEGRYHQIKRMFEAVGLNVTYLRRDRMGNLTLGNLKTGDYVKVCEKDIKTCV